MRVTHRISNTYNNLSLRRKLTIVFTFFLSVLIIGIGAFTYQISISNLEKSEKELLASNFVLKGEMLNTFFMTIQRKVDLLFNNELIQSALQENYANYTISELIEKFDNLYKITTPINEDISSLNNTNQYRENSGVRIKLYPFNETIPVDGGLVHSYASIADEPWVAQMIKNPNQVYWFSAVKGFNDLNYISVNRIMLDFSTFKQLGIISIMIPELNIIENLRQTPNSTSELVIQTDKGLYQNPSSAHIFNDDDLADLINESNAISYMQIGLIDNRKMLYSFRDLAGNDWKLYLFYPFNEITKKMRPIQIATIIFLLIGLAFSEILILLISRRLSRRLELITSKFVKITEDRLAPVTVIGGNDEIGKLDREFNTMISTLNALIEKENYWELEKNGLTLELLQAQINPHLLYNTLATIEWKAKRGESSEIQGITRKLIFFFKYYLNNGSLITPVTDELKMLEEFVDIFIFTYQLTCKVDFQIETDVVDLFSIKLFLQPIVENALQHGIRPVNSERSGKLLIKATREDQDLLFEIRDNGLGMKEEQLDDLENERLSSSRGFGVHNVRNRINLYFGKGYGIHFSSSEGQSTLVTVRVPALLEDELTRIVNT